VARRLSYTLADCVARHEAYPQRFQLKPWHERTRLRQGHIVKLIFEAVHPRPGIPKGERMWVRVTQVFGSGSNVTYEGVLDNIPTVIPGLRYGATVHFGPQHVADIFPLRETPMRH